MGVRLYPCSSHQGDSHRQVVVPQGVVRQVGGQALPGATVNVIDPVTGDIIATTTTDANGNYQVEVPP